MPVALHTGWVLEHVGKRFDGFEANEFLLSHKKGKITSLGPNGQ
jgi:hypothetical protein